jgi:hypothetical protein
MLGPQGQGPHIGFIDRARWYDSKPDLRTVTVERDGALGRPGCAGGDAATLLLEVRVADQGPRTFGFDVELPG